MKRYKKIYVLLAVLVVISGATFGVMQYEEKKEEIKNSDEIILELDKDTVTALSWENEETSLAFHKDEEWIYDADEAFPVDKEAVEDMLEIFEEFGVSFIIENVEDYGQYGLDDPVCTIQMTADEKDYEIKVGDFSDMDEERYVSIGDGNVYLVTEDPLDTFDAVLNDMIQHDETPSFEKVTKIQFAGAESYRITYEEDSKHTYCPDDVYFVEQDGRTLPLDTSIVDGYLDDISSLGLTNFVTYNATDEELAEYGLDNPALSVTVDYTYEVEDEESEETKTESDTFVFHVGLNVSEKAAKEAETDEEKAEEMEVTAYFRVGDSQIVYEITSDNYDSFVAVAYDDLRHKEVLTVDTDEIKQIDITLEDANYTITSKVEDEERTYYYQEEELDITNLRTKMTALTADSFTDKEASGKLEIAFTVHLENKNYSEVKVELYRYDGDHCLAVVDGESVSLVERSYVVDLIEAVNAIVL